MTAGKTIRVRDLASARSGDKGNHANIGVVANDEAAYGVLCSRLTAVKSSCPWCWRAAYTAGPSDGMKRSMMP